MSASTLINEGIDLFEEEKYQAAIEKLNEALGSIQDKSQQIEEQIYAQALLGRCYFKQAIKAQNAKEAKLLFVQAIEYNKQRLELAKQIENKQESIKQQTYAQAWLGGCYRKQALITQNEKTAKKLLERAITHHNKELKLAKKFRCRQESIKQQIYAQSFLGRCYLALSLNPQNKAEAKPFLEKATKYYQKQLDLAKQIDDKQKSIEEQTDAQEQMGLCCFEKALISKNTSVSDLLEYLQIKELVIKQKLFSDLEKPNTICTILAILYTPNHELRNTTFAHYTTANVAELLFGINQDKKISNMRMNSATYMNDPYEGKSLLEFLGKPEESLENITEFPEYNAFFSCFSSRVNDLNQFRLYGKEYGVEASGCCLVFNKNGDWLKGSDITKSFSSVKEQEETSISMLSEKKYSLYQIAYLAYLDEYIDIAKYKDEMIKEDNSKFAIYLPQIGSNDKWHELRLKKLKKALVSLKREINQKDTKFDQQALEYIRYLFKDFAFKDEEEFRMLTLNKLGDDTKCCETTNSVFVEYGDISNMVDEVILGTNYEKTTKNRKVEVFRHKMIESGFKNVKVTQSSLPINANLPIPEKKNQ